MSDIFYLVHPPKIASRDPLMGGDPIVKQIPAIKNKTLHQYLQELHLNELRTHCRVTLDPNNTRLRLSYSPKPGDVVRMERAGRALS